MHEYWHLLDSILCDETDFWWMMLHKMISCTMFSEILGLWIRLSIETGSAGESDILSARDNEAERHSETDEMEQTNRSTAPYSVWHTSTLAWSSWSLASLLLDYLLLVFPQTNRTQLKQCILSQTAAPSFLLLFSHTVLFVVWSMVLSVTALLLLTLYAFLLPHPQMPACITFPFLFNLFLCGCVSACVSLTKISHTHSLILSLSLSLCTAHCTVHYSQG